MTGEEEGPGPSEPHIPAVAAPTRRRIRVSIALTGLATALIVYLIASRGHEILVAAQRISVPRFAAITALTLIPLGLRSVSWKVAISDITKVSLPFAWNVTALVALGGYVNIYLGFAARVTFARRFGPKSFTIANLGVAEGAMIAIEAVIALGLVALFATRVGVPLVLGLLGFALAVGVLILLRRLALRGATILRGSAFGNPRSLAIIAVLLAGVLLLQIFRVALALEAVGLPYSAFTATVAFLAMGILATLPIGPGSFPAAMALVFVGHDLDKALAAGLAVLSASLLAALIAAPPALYMLWRNAPRTQT
jgi:hypothetical protein